MSFPQFASFFGDHFELFGLGACLIVLIALVIPMFFYTGRGGERYSMLNHFVSELGERGVSRAAGVFNAGMIAAGFLFIPFDIGMGLSVPNIWAKLGMAAGVVTAVGLILIGFFSMDKLKPHIFAAMTFFDGGLATIILFTIAVWAQPTGAEILPRGIFWIGVICILVFIVFLALNPRPASDIVSVDFLRLNPMKNRPRVWMMPISEWLVVGISTAWYLSTALVLFLR